MPLTTGPLSARRYHARPPDGIRSQAGELLRHHAWREPEKPTQDVVQGWVHLDHPEAIDFTNPESYTFGTWLCFSLRTGRRILPQRLLVARLGDCIQRWCRINQMARCPVSVRGDLRDQVIEDLLKQSAMSVHLYEVAWDLDSELLLIDSLSNPVSELFGKIFQKTFGVRPEVDSPYQWIIPGHAERLLVTTPSPWGSHGG